MKAGSPPIQIQLPLTGHTRDDIVDLHSLFALPDGSGVIYSANVANGEGDYELYRVLREGGEPVPVTNTPRDEFAPAVSPDGQWIAHVSNHLGNIDVFLIPVGGGEKKHARITELKYRQLSGMVRVKTLNELGEETPVRLFVRAADGKAYSPPGSAIRYDPLDPQGDREGFFIANGDMTFPAPVGALRLVALKGIEHKILETRTSVAAGETTDGAFIHDKEFFTNAVSSVSNPATCCIGGRCTATAIRQGGLVSLVHPILGNIWDVFDTDFGAKKAPVTAPFGAVEAIDVLPYGPGAYEFWRRFLNSDCFTNSKTFLCATLKIGAKTGGA